MVGCAGRFVVPRWEYVKMNVVREDWDMDVSRDGFREPLLKAADAAVRAVCGERVTTPTRIRGWIGWEDGHTGELRRRGVVMILHPACWLRTTPEERDELLKAASEDWYGVAAGDEPVA